MQTLGSLEKTLYKMLEEHKAEILASDLSVAYDGLYFIAEEVENISDEDLFSIVISHREMGEFQAEHLGDIMGNGMLEGETSVYVVIEYNIRQYLTDKVRAWQKERKA